MNKSLAQNLSICIGRLALISAEKVGKYMDLYIKPFCISLRYVNDSIEKRDAFRGLCKAILHNPKGIFGSFNFFCGAICLFENPPNDLEQLFHEVIYSLNVIFKNQFLMFINEFPSSLKMKMIQRFKLKID